MNYTDYLEAKAAGKSFNRFDKDYINLTGANLTGANLTGANLTDANLTGADLTGADLTGADLASADLSGADLSDANLSGADLSGADLSGANLWRANLTGADLSGADLWRANLTSADLSDANLYGADLSDANLYGADLHGADLYGAILRGAILYGANLSGAINILSTSQYLEENFEFLPDGSMVVYKSFGTNYASPEKWLIEAGSILEEVCNPDRGTLCGCGINVAKRDWPYFEENKRDLWKAIIKPQWLGSVVVPFGTDGKIRCEKIQLVEIINKREE